MMESQQKAQQPVIAEGSGNGAPAERQEQVSAETFDDMSVDELNALDPSERRRNMMEALERRKAKAAQ
jgi:hypothetical protein